MSSRSKAVLIATRGTAIFACVMLACCGAFALLAWALMYHAWYFLGALVVLALGGVWWGSYEFAINEISTSEARAKLRDDDDGEQRRRMRQAAADRPRPMSQDDDK